LQRHAQEYASDNGAFLHAFAGAWAKLMNADRFDGPVRNACDNVLV
jgi:catalase (peroxidase I)